MTGIEIAINLGTTVAGVVGGWLLGHYVEPGAWRRTPIQAGQWKSLYFSPDEKGWKEGDAAVSRDFLGPFKLDEPPYISRGRVRNGFLIGTWEGSAAIERGAFLLRITQNGRAMHGFWAGPTQGGPIEVHGWALGADDRALAQAKALVVKELRIPKA